MNFKIFVFVLVALSVVMAQTPHLFIVDSTNMGYGLPGSDNTFMTLVKDGMNNFVATTSSDAAIIYTDDCDQWGDPYSGGVRVIQNFSGNTALLNDAINGMQDTDSSSPPAAALNEAKSYLVDRDRKANIVLILYDMGATCGDGDPIQAASDIYANGEGVGTVSVIGFMSRGGDAESTAKSIAQAGGGKYYHIDAEGDFENALAGFEQLPPVGTASQPENAPQQASTPPQNVSQTPGSSQKACPIGALLILLVALAVHREL